jgi:hypothetical protein
MTITNGYCTQAEFNAFRTVRGGPSVVAETSDDGVIDSIVEAVSRYIDRETGRFFYKDSTDATRYYQTEDPVCLKVDDLSTSPTTVSVDYNDQRSYTALDSGDWEVEPVNAAADGKPYTRLYIAPTSSAYFPPGRRGVKVVGKFGWPAVPTDIKEICEEICLNVWTSRSGQSSAGNVTVTASGIVIRPNDVPARAQKIFENYRKYL